MIKCNEIDSPNSCLSKADDFEPLFVLRANDPLAPALVRLWANEYFLSKKRTQDTPLTDRQMAKYTEAKTLASQMEAWKAEQAALTDDRYL
jgi:hypothetical protein